MARSPMNEAALAFVRKTPGWSTKKGTNHCVMIVRPDGKKMPLHPTPEGGAKFTSRHGYFRIRKIYREFGLPV